MYSLTTRDACLTRQNALPSRWGVFAMLAAFFLLVGTATHAQEDDPDGLLVPPGLKKIAETPPASQDAGETDPAAPRTVVGDESDSEIVGRVVRVEDSILTILDGKDQTRKFRASASTRIERNGQRGRLRDLQPGDAVRLKTAGDPNSALMIVAVTPPPTGDREPDQQLRQKRQTELQNEDDAQEQQRMQNQSQQAGGSSAGGRVWMVMMDPDGGAAESGMRPGDVILIVDSQMVQAENVLGQFNLPSGLFPLRSNSNGEVFIGPNGAGVGIVGPGGVLVPTGANLGIGGIGPNGANLNPNPLGAGSGAINNQQPTVGDDNFGPPIGRRQNPADRNFGPPIGGGQNPGNRNFGPSIGTGNTPAPGAPAAGANVPAAGANVPAAGANVPAAGGAGAGAAAGGAGAATGAGAAGAGAAGN